MKHVKVFEDFYFPGQENPGQPGEKFKVTIELDSENPDATYGCTVEGIGDTLDEAARFAFALVCKFIVSGDDCEDIKHLMDFEAITETICTKKEVEDAISSIVQREELESDFFSDHGTTSRNTIEVERGTFPENGGFIIDQYSHAEYE